MDPSNENMKKTSPAIKIQKDSISFNWRTVILLFLLIGGGGSFAGLNWLNGNKENGTKDAKVNPLSDIPNHGGVHKKIDDTLEYHGNAIVEQGKLIVEVKTTVGAVQDVQHKQVAREEARRVTVTIVDRNRREKEYDRLVDLNLRRLSRGQEPCTSIDCNN